MILAVRGWPVPGSGSPTPPPLDPSAAHAREQLQHELSKLGYQQAKPDLIQDIVQWLGNLINSLLNALSGRSGSSVNGSAVIAVVIIVAVIAAVVIGFLVFGRPRLNRRSSLSGSLFGEDDERDSDTLRDAAMRAAADGDFTTAIEELFRSIARGLAERTVVTTFPGTTANGFAREAEHAFPEFGSRLRQAADSFDGVRYLGATGSQEQWLEIRALEADLRNARPALEAADA